MKAGFDTLDLASLSLPEGGLTRDYARPAARRDALYEARYDRLTLVYDHWVEGGRIHFVTPRLLNLWPVVKTDLAPKRRRHLRWEHLTAPLSARSLNGLPLSPGAPLTDRFAGLRVLMAVSKNNPIDWITAWARHHVATQGTETVLLFDNGSTDYDAADITAALSGVPGLKSALVVRAPFPYGPAHGRTAKLEVSARFFQTAMFNLARLRMLGQARSVLSLDIDEMATGPSAHAAAEQSLVGLLQLNGTWVYAAQTGGRKPQAAHDHRPATPQSCMPKWCVAPRRLAGKMAWTVHRIFGDFDALFSGQTGFVHCQQCSTGWKVAREGTVALRHDPGLTALWARSAAE